MTIPSLNKKSAIILSGVLFFVLILVIATTAFLGKSRKASPAQQANTNNNQQLKANSQVAASLPPLPQIEVKSWTAGKAPAATLASSPIYDLQQNLSEKEIQIISKKFLGVTNHFTKSKTGIYTDYLESAGGRKDISAFVYNPSKGEFSYASSRGILLPQANVNATLDTKASNFLSTLFADPTIKITVSYKKKSKPGIIYFEAHRDWQATGLPILNAFGLLNLPQTKPLSTLSLTPPSNLTADPDIYAVSDGSDGLARQDDFNTATLGIKETDSTVASLQSNIRQLLLSPRKVSQLISYDQALLKLENKQYDLLYTSPSGEGTPAMSKVYPGNKGQIEEAVIQDSTLAYLENPPELTQNQLSPYYIMRGNATLASGYRVNFIVAVSAKNTSVLGANTLAQIPATQQQGTFRITGSPNVGHCGTALTCPPTPTPPANNPQCGNGGPTCTPSQTPLPEPPPHCGTTLTCPPNTPPFATPPLPEPTKTCGELGTCPPGPQPTLTCEQLGTCPPAAPTLTCDQLGNCPPGPQPTLTCEQLGTCPPAEPTKTCGELGTCPPPAEPTKTCGELGTCPPPSTSVCIPDVSELTNNQSVSSNVAIAQLTEAGKARIKATRAHPGQIIEVGDWYSYSNGSSLTAEDIVDSIQAARNANPDQDLGPRTNHTTRTLQDLADNPNCPVRITGTSPTVIVYGKPGQTVHIQPNFEINYADPGLFQKNWVVTLQANGELAVNNELVPYLYYEYNNHAFARPQYGWTISKNNISEWVETLTSKLRLTAREKNRLAFEINHATSSVPNNVLFIGLIPQSQIDSKLPLSVTGVTQITRLHFYVGESLKQVKEPKLTPVLRSESMILEIGATAQN